MRTTVLGAENWWKSSWPALNRCDTLRHITTFYDTLSHWENDIAIPETHGCLHGDHSKYFCWFRFWPLDFHFYIQAKEKQYQYQNTRKPNEARHAQTHAPARPSQLELLTLLQAVSPDAAGLWVEAMDSAIFCYVWFRTDSQTNRCAIIRRSRRPEFCMLQAVALGQRPHYI